MVETVVLLPTSLTKRLLVPPLQWTHALYMLDFPINPNMQRVKWGGWQPNDFIFYSPLLLLVIPLSPFFEWHINISNKSIHDVHMVKYSTLTTLSVQIFSELIPALKQHTMERNALFLTIAYCFLGGTFS